ncbi:ABC transporter ATP-binding protein [Algoriphagus halophilus]|uniref:ABC-type polysaccharide/polyol phosphate transport system, ATPase component n=1 Tax=Algoriphagus halophilus TaxID=226505 RepID=A0A1N6ECX2_9BACT|nr:ABC transporter ATP-binding protein [Algoriphagus halophilus]SIN80885.1 ABC-type polysaccharide/polyol phosphate transport system, ATPase component [Algoriphagus halophilus]
MSESVIKVSNLSKRYRLGLKEKQAETFVGQIGNLIKSPWQNLRRLREMSRFGIEDDSVFWALKDLNFDVKEGEVLGIIGKNGAGKSTLLKILSQITEPTSGKIEIHGRVASLLEVGTGFHPELSGRENIYMNGTILGMTSREIDSKLDEIIDFSGVEKFIDTPVKFYSSGMKVRLGFSVAAHLEPEILIIDEVLAVGDYEFQAKCLGKMEDVAGQGRTVLFVSHDLPAISNLCNRVLVLENGSELITSETPLAIERYLNRESFLNESATNHFPKGDNGLLIKEVKVHTSHPQNIHRFGDPLDISFELEAPEGLDQANIAFQIVHSTSGRPALYSWLHHKEMNIGEKEGVYYLKCHFPSLKLYYGKYHLTLHFSELDGTKNVMKIENINSFEVSMMNKPHQFSWGKDNCVYIDDFNWSVELKEK